MFHELQVFSFWLVETGNDQALYMTRHCPTTTSYVTVWKFSSGSKLGQLSAHLICLLWHGDYILCRLNIKCLENHRFIYFFWFWSCFRSEGKSSPFYSILVRGWRYASAPCFTPKFEFLKWNNSFPILFLPWLGKKRNSSE